MALVRETPRIGKEPTTHPPKTSGKPFKFRSWRTFGEASSGVRRLWVWTIALLIGLLGFVPSVYGQQASFGGGQGQQTVRLEWAQGSNPGGTGHRNGTLSTERPAGVTGPPAREGLLWGELSLGPSGRYTFAAKAPGGAGADAVTA
ncbi:MAG: hypothetical protein HYU64_20475 [Armatimonadetes bacterium]|nr:hypothetical protein [Armatimonadota bacterium]